jgi:hypothetical protein
LLAYGATMNRHYETALDPEPDTDELEVSELNFDYQPEPLDEALERFYNTLGI